jgi:Na+-driven multidrug efflux pump
MLSTVQELFMEVVELLGLALPSALIMFLDASPWIIDLFMLGHLGKGNLASGSLAISYFMMNWVVIEGVLSAYETLAGHATTPSGSRDKLEIRLVTYAAIGCIICVCALCSCTFAASPWVFSYFFPDNGHVVFKAWVHCLILIPTLWTNAINRVLSKYFHLSKMLHLALAGGAVAFGVNLIGNYLLMYAFGFGFIGCAVVTVFARVCATVVNIICLKQLKQYNK